ncbi:MAG: DegV family protein [Oscillospiraceae bacterium]
MNYPYHIMTDASADVDRRIAEAEDIRFVPMIYSIGDEERICDGMSSEETMKSYYDEQRHGALTRTTQISPQNYDEMFRPLAEKGESILYLSLSGGLSSTYTSSLMAAKELMDDYPGVDIICVDSRAATGGIGMLLELAAKNRAAGMDIKENAAWLEENRLRVCHWFMVEDLMYLKRGGRISPTTAVLGTALNIKPILKIEADGTLTNFAKKRGAKAAMNQLVELYRQSSSGEPGERIYIVHADNLEGAEYLEAAVRKINPGCSIARVMMTPVIGSHTGPGLCAIVNFARPECARS